MKKLGLIVIFIVICLMIYVVAGPHITIHQIKAGIDQQDSEKLSDNIDFPALRSNLKEQFNAVFMKTTATELEGNPFAALALGMAAKLIDGIVDAFITPSGLASLMAGKKPPAPDDYDKGDQTEQNEKVPKTELFKKARYTYDSLSKFSAWIADDNGQEIRFVFKRDGLTWKLNNIIIPFEE